MRSWISDPDDQPEKWLRFGAPAGLASLPLARGVFPAIDHAPAIDPCDLCVDEDVFTNYAGIDQDEVAQVEVTDLHRRGKDGCSCLKADAVHVLRNGISVRYLRG